MRGTDLVLVVLTFFTGVFFGAYLYITVYAPEYRESDAPVAVEDTAFSLMGQQYGGCDRLLQVCDSFTLEEDRSYTFAAGYVPSEPAPKDVTGRLDRETFDALIAAVTETNLALLEDEREEAACASAADANDYRYRLIYEGEEFFFDTCSTRFTTSGLATVFARVWPEVTEARTVLDEAGDVNLGETVESFIDDQFKYDDE